MKINDKEKNLKGIQKKKMHMTFNEATVKLMIDFFNRNCESHKTMNGMINLKH